jgi:hypothetical protein
MAYISNQWLREMDAAGDDVSFRKALSGGFRAVEHIDPTTGNRVTTITNDRGLAELEKRQPIEIDVTAIAQAAVDALDLDGIADTVTEIVKKRLAADQVEVSIDDLKALALAAISEAA